ncbi:MAG TPA: hypothetical protein D7I03_06275 [Candidatus Poseidoniales archaeon]|nr:MAG TPA: hypothetical protein D7I03_06275 [Candidatus Poseidoniales archaeon]HII50930.1 hypothetical protein [Candidatus Poseidoniaceae archaeon]|tara:strand:+ start:1212 stop:4307 length:3096 start_codon:yes stop_codon:yes gene_type:complete
MAKSRRLIGTVLLLLLMPLFLPVVSADGMPQQPQINTLWLANEFGENNHAYRVTFADGESYQAVIDVEHERAGEDLDVEILQSWDLVDGFRILDIQLNTSLDWNDIITVSVSITHYAEQELDEPMMVEREFEVGTWNQPMDDHEIMLETTWLLDQIYNTSEGPQGFNLNFTGQGWQQRIGDTIESWELGNGSISFLESTDLGSNNLSLDLESIWKNETIQSGILTSQVFEAVGSGVLHIISMEDDVNTSIIVEVTNAELNRSIINQVISERLKIDANGVLNISSQESENSSFAVNGDIGVFYLETWDENGVRRFYDQRFEAIADMIIIDDGSRLDIDVNTLNSGETWNDGVRTSQIEEVVGSGTFGFSESDNESSVNVNGTIYQFHTKSEQGITLVDDIHIDGVITGDVQGDFGVVRGIELTGMQANATGIEFPVNVIHEESWFNLTGINGGNFFDGAGIGATHNQTWDYQVIYSDWENRTVRLVWEESGADSSSGEEFPERSPIEKEPEPPEVEEALGNLTVSRETGLMPIPMHPGDKIRLDGQEGLTLVVTAEAVTNDPRDGHNFHVVSWSGVYEGSESGTATGAIIDEGPLKGLISSVSRVLAIPFGEEGNLANFTETQLLTRVISPAVVTAEENSAPIISGLYLLEGLVVSEGGSVATLVAEVSDVDWNLEQVTVDLTPIGGSIVVMNDRGIDGDAAIGDDKYSTLIVVPGLEVGDFTLAIEAQDSFDSISSSTGQITVVNQAPRLTSAEILPNQGPRGTNMVVNVEAYDGHGVSEISIDLQEYGGGLFELVENSGIWTTMLIVPEGMSPGKQTLEFVTVDGLGKVGLNTVWLNGQRSTSHPYGPHFIPDDEAIPIEITVENSPPLFNIPSPIKYTRPESSTTVVFEVEILDSDGITNARANLGVFAPLSAQTGWVVMNDNGINGDAVPGDGIYSVELSLRTSTPIGTHEILIQAIDGFDVATPITPVSVIVVEESSLVPSLDSDTLSSSVLIVILIGFTMVAGISVFFLMRKGKDKEYLEDRFGFE